MICISGSMAGTLGKKNPFRYRGYYYDEETGMYYLKSRYYDPKTCRFIKVDSQLNPVEGMTGFNMFQYCGNNPVNRADPTRKIIYFRLHYLGGIIGALDGGHIAGSSAKKSSNPNVSSNWGWYALGGGIISGGVGALAGWGVGSVVTAIGATATGTAAINNSSSSCSESG